MESLWFLHLVSVSFSEESMMKTSLISGLILLIVYSCARNEDTLDKYTIAGTKGGIDTTAPKISSTSTSDTSVSVSFSISVTFSESMNTTSVTTNSSGTSCTGTLQVSSDNFSSCVQMSSSPTVSNSNKTFTVTSSASLSYNTIYKIRIGTGVKDISGNSLATQFTSVFKTITTSFTAHTITTSANGAYSVYAVDIDGDGDIDVLSASVNDDKIAWYENLRL